MTAKRRRASPNAELEANELVLTIPKAGRLLGLSRNTAYNAVARGELPAIRFGRRLVIPRAALDRVLLEGATKAKR